MFRRPVFYDDLLNGRIPDALLVAMFAVACRFLPDDKCNRLFGPTCAPWEHFSELAHRKSREDMVREQNMPVTLNSVRAACLLALYEYTSSPSRQAWILVGNAMRLAIMAQLHQVDCAYYAEGLSPGDRSSDRLKNLL